MPTVSDYVIVKKTFEWVQPGAPARMVFFLPADLADSQAVLHYTLRVQYGPDQSVMTINVKVNGAKVDSSSHNPLHEPNPEWVHGATSIIDAAHFRPVFPTPIAPGELLHHLRDGLPSSGDAVATALVDAEPVTSFLHGFNVLEFEQQHAEHGAMVGEVVLNFRREVD
ncbi:MAG: hypothetical protein AAGD18_07665 [Actinomycetota bacterium]